MLKKRLLLAVVLILLLVSNVRAENVDLYLSCKSALLMDFDTGTILYENNSHERLPPASVTKIMTMLIAMEYIDDGKVSYDDVVIGSAYAKSMGGSTIFLDEGEQLSVSDILKGIAVSSGNDAAVAMAEHIAGSAAAFVDMMNKRAQELGMKDTNFVNCNGLDAENHYTTAYDIALMSAELLKHEDIHKFTTIWQDSLRDGKFTLSNTNKLVRFYDGCTGLKTGSTSKAGFCISATARRDDMHLIAVVMASPTSKQRQKDASSLLNYGFANYSLKTVAKKGDIMESIKISKGASEFCDLVCAEDIKFLVKKGENINIKKDIEIKKSNYAPIKKGSIAGKIIIKDGDKEIKKADLLYEKNIKRLTVMRAYGIIADEWLGR